MAFDEALLLKSQHHGFPVLRFYSWTGTPASFGYFQRFAEVEAETVCRPLVRRCTGGGIVEHSSDWTYSLAIPPTHSWWHLKAQESYQRIHAWCVRALGHLSIPATLAPEPDNSGIGRCFIGAEKDDILLDGRKIGGAAQRRNQHGLLIQGSLQNLPAGHSREDWIHAMISTSLDPVEKWDDWNSLEFTRAVRDLDESKYKLQRYLEKR